MKRRRNEECSTAALDVEDVPPVQSVIESSHEVAYPCRTALPKDDDTPLEFRIDRTDAFVDLRNTTIHLTVQVLNADGSSVESGVAVAPVNNIGYAMFSDVDLFIGDKLITEATGNYPYWTYIDLLLHTTPLTRKTMLRGDAWFPDDPGKFNILNIDDPVIYNQGFVDRHSVFGLSRKVDLVMDLKLNKMYYRLISPNTEIMIKMYRSPNNFCLMHDGTYNYKIRITEASIMATRVKLTATALTHYNRLLHSKGFLYPSVTKLVKTLTVSKNDQNVEWIPFQGLLPQRIYFCQVLQSAFNGTPNKNPYNFHAFNLSRFQVYRNGTSLPLQTGLTQDYGSYLSMYLSTLKAINSPETVDIMLPDYVFGYFIVVVNLTNDLTIGQGYSNPLVNGTLRVAIDYDKPLEEPITLICVAEIPEVLTIHGS